QITAKKIFEYQTIAELARVTGEVVHRQAEQGPVTGELPLTPIQSWFFEKDYANPHHWNQSVTLITGKPLNDHLLENIYYELEQHHDALRLRYKLSCSGELIQYIDDVSQSSLPITCYDLSEESAAKQKEFIAKTKSKAQKNVNMYDGPLWNAVYFKQSESKGCLFWVIHHLTIDGVSWRILIEDFETAYHQLMNRENITLPSKTTSFKEWAYRLTDYASSADI